MNPIEKIREYVRELARKVKKEQKQNLREELELRKYIRKLLREIEEVSPHDSTGVNVLEDLLKTIVPILEAGYKRLTSDVSQRKSFRSHILRAVQNLLSTESIYFNIDKKGSVGSGKATLATPGGDLNEQEDDAKISVDVKTDKKGNQVEQDPAFIDIEKDKKEKEAKEAAPKPEDAFAPIEGEDPTGRGFALRSFQKIQKQILDAYSLLGKDEDREVFYDYLITNLKLYFDKFEDELQKTLQEPTTPEYEQEKQKKAASLGNSGEDTASDNEDEPEDMDSVGGL